MTTPSGTGHAAPGVDVAMLTYRRQVGLPEAIGAIRRQLDRVPGSRLLVVDNDDTPSAEPVVHAAAQGDRRVRYVHEPRPGIASARNRALDECADRDLLVFIDDDERPGDDWLPTLVATWVEHRSAAVVGPVLSTFSGPVDPWITAGGFFVRLRHPTGTVVRTAATNNLLLDIAQVAALSLRFDEAFGLSGGSDTVFTRQLSAAGGRIVWCDEAPVFDAVTPERATRSWVVARVSRVGNSDTRASVYLARGRHRRATARAVATFRGSARVTVGAVRLGYGRLRRSIVHEARGARMLLRGAGMVRGAWGAVFYEYRR